MEATQLAGGGASADEEVNATQPPDDADTLESTQPADDGGKACARFVRVAGPQRVAMEAETQFEVLWQHGDRVELGRASSSGPGGPARVVLCVSSAQGISRQHGWLRYDRQRGMEFTVCSSAAAAVTFINGQYLAASAPTVVLKDGDKLGFGGSSVEEPGPGTVIYEAHFVGMPELIQMPPPPPPTTATKRGRVEMEGATSAEEPRGRGEKSSAARKRRKAEAKEAKEATTAASPAAKVAGGLAAQAALANEHATLVASLSSEQRRWARRGLECASQCYGIMQEAVRMAAEEDGGGVLHTAIVRMQHKIQALAGESARAQQGERSRARTEQQQHARHDHAAQRRNQAGGGRGRGNGGGKGGDGKGSGKGGYGKGGYGKGGGGGKGGSGGGSGRRRR